MATYYLKDVWNDNDTSKIDNFTKQWLKWYPYVKRASYDLQMSDKDVILVNLYKDNPYGKYVIPAKAKKLFIVHAVSDKTAEYINDADFVIYLNDIIKQIVVDIVGIDKPHVVVPRNPMHVFNTEVRQKKFVYIGGWFTEEKVLGLVNKLLNLHKELPIEYDFCIFPVWGKTEKNLKSIYKFENEIKSIAESEFGKRMISITDKTENFYDIMVLKTRIATHALLWDNGPTIEKVKDLINSRDIKILDYHIEESSMLALYQSSPTNIIVDRNVKYRAFFEKIPLFTYQDFSQIVKEIISKMIS